ncbi:MAG: hypothetical protein AAF633_08485 [Chloroflexota bacterium]
MSDIITSRDEHPNQIKPAARKSNFVIRWLGIILIAIALLAIFYGTVLYFGWQSGESIRETKIASERTETISRQKELAFEDINQSRYELAMRRLDYVLAESPTDPEALALREQAEIGWATLLTPTPTMTSTPSPTPTPTLSPTPSAVVPTSDPAEAVREAQDAFEALMDGLSQTNLAQNIIDLEAFRTQYASYERRTVDQALYDAYIAYGLILTRGNELEKGLGYLYLAGNLRDLPEDVLGEIFWAEQYLDGIVYYGINWDAYFSYFRPLCDYVPTFQDSCGQLQKGLIFSASEAELNLDWCVAVSLYEEAIRVKGTTAEINEKVENAKEACELATPTPEILGSVTPDPSSDLYFATPTNLTLPDNFQFDPAVTPSPARP